MAALWRLVAIFLVVLNSTEQSQCSFLTRRGEHNCGPCLCSRSIEGRDIDYNADCVSRNLSTVPAEIPDNITVL